MEHYHRVYGRLLGLGIILPSLGFSLLGGGSFVSWRTRKFLLASSSLVVFQVSIGADSDSDSDVASRLGFTWLVHGQERLGCKES